MYRDANNLCPRCGTVLVRAGAARGCDGCRGVWLPVANLQEMANSMRSPPQPVYLGNVVENRPSIPCPDCTDPMSPILTLGISLDMCTKNHGVWFDANELSTLLFRLATTPT